MVTPVGWIVTPAEPLGSIVTPLGWIVTTVTPVGWIVTPAGPPAVQGKL